MLPPNGRSAVCAFCGAASARPHTWPPLLRQRRPVGLPRRARDAGHARGMSGLACCKPGLQCCLQENTHGSQSRVCVGQARLRGQGNINKQGNIGGGLVTCKLRSWHARQGVAEQRLPARPRHDGGWRRLGGVLAPSSSCAAR